MTTIDHIVGSLIIAIAMASAWAWLWALSRWLQREPLLPFEPRRHAPWGLVDVMGMAALLFAAQVAVMGLMKEQFGIDVALEFAKATPDQRAARLLAAVVTQLSATAVGVVVIAQRTRCTWADVGISLRRAPRDLLVGTVAFVMLAPPVFGIQAALVQFWPYEHPLLDLVKDDARFLLMSAFAAVIAAPLNEEYLFRVLLQGWLEKLATWRGLPLGILLGGGFDRPDVQAAKRKPGERQTPAALVADSERMTDDNPYAAPRTYGKVEGDEIDSAKQEFASAPPTSWPIAVSAFIFALMHWGNGPAPIPLFVLAVGLGYLYQRTHRALPSITVHFLLNGATMLMLYLQLYVVGES